MAKQQEQGGERLNVIIGRCHFGDVSPLFFNSYEKMQKPMNADGTPAWHVAVAHRHVTPFARTKMVEEMLAGAGVFAGATHLFFMDDDMIFPQDALMRLLARDVPIVGGLYFAKPPSYAPVAFTWGPEGQAAIPPDHPIGDGLIEVDYVGSGCMLVKREVFERLERPWFDYTLGAKGTDHIGTSLEDMYFCRKAQAAGYKILLDGGVRCGHITTRIITYDDYPGPLGTGAKFSDF